MSDVNSGISKASDIVTGVARALVGLLIALIVLFVLAGIVFPADLQTLVEKSGDVAAHYTGVIPDVIKGLTALVKSALGGWFCWLVISNLVCGFSNTVEINRLLMRLDFGRVSFYF